MINYCIALNRIKILLTAIGILLCLSSCSTDDTQSQARQPIYAPEMNRAIMYQQQQQNRATPRRDGYYYAPSPNYGAYQSPPPASRYYSNPYAFPPQNAYPYYDGDQYYTPPSYYGGGDSSGYVRGSMSP